MNIVVPMAGLGSRFAQAGFTLPKPLIAVDTAPMYRWAVDSLPLELATSLIFILRQDSSTPRLITDINKAYAGFKPKVLVLEHPTRGQAETVWMARDMLDLAQPTLVHNADTAFALGVPWTSHAEAFGVLVTFKDDSERWSYARTDAAGRVVEVREKKVISRHASTGTYFFQDSRWLIRGIEDMIEADQREGGEFYIGPLYNRAIGEGRDIFIEPCSAFHCFGTPADLDASLPTAGELRDALRARRAATSTGTAFGIELD